MKYYLAIDIGASSGRHIVGWCDNNTIKTKEVYRFPNAPTPHNGHLVWDIDGLFASVLEGIKVAFQQYPDIRSLAIDTWGVDYVLINNNCKIMPCYSYRDSRTQGIIEQVHNIIDFASLYQRTGIQYQPFNTIYQLYQDNASGRLDSATDFLMIPEYLNYMLTGVKMHEYTNATTTGLVNANSGQYDNHIIDALNLPSKLFGKLHPAGTTVGLLQPNIAQYVGGQTEVVLCASHDTASAVEAIPMATNSPYISSGTWSLLGVKVDKAIITDSSRIANYSNEGGIGYVRFQKNIMGMWVVNRLKDELCPDIDFGRIVDNAKHSTYNGYVDVNHQSFLAPDSMVAVFDKWLEGSGENPRTASDYFRSAYVSLAISYKTALQELRDNSGLDFDTLYIIGGGAKNTLLNQLTEQICNIKVKALPIEATAIGNLKIQIGRR